MKSLGKTFDQHNQSLHQQLQSSATVDGGSLAWGSGKITWIKKIYLWRYKRVFERQETSFEIFDLEIDATSVSPTWPHIELIGLGQYCRAGAEEPKLNASWSQSQNYELVLRHLYIYQRLEKTL